MERSTIAWCDATYQGWIGCSQIGPGCRSCYAKAWNARFAGGTAANWGPGAPRRRTSARYRQQPLLWNRIPFWACASCGWRGLETRWKKVSGCLTCPDCGGDQRTAARMRVFCSSLSDVFDNEVDDSWRAELLDLMERTPELDWLIVTKRVGNVDRMVPAGWFERNRHVGLGTTVCTQEEADREIAKLVRIRAAMRFVSMEPLLEEVTIAKWLDPWSCSHCYFHGSEADSGPCRCDACDVETRYDAAVGSDRCPSCQETDCSASHIGASCPHCKSAEGWSRDYGFRFDSDKPSQIDWVIVGGESGAEARPMHAAWARRIRDECHDANVAFLFKQWGEHAPAASRAGEDGPMVRVGKEKAGRLLDGVLHNAFPARTR